MRFSRVGLFVFLIGAGCASQPQLVKIEKSQYVFNRNEFASADSSFLNFIYPYKVKLDKEMYVVIGKTSQPLTKGQPESLLGNFVADLSMREVEKKYQPDDGKKIDFCFLNNGGLRSELPGGEITQRNAFEVMPFENEYVILTLSGNQVMEICNWIAGKGGVPVAGLRMKINGGTPENILIRNQSFDINKNYIVITSDYLANGGDNLFFLNDALKREYAGLKIRDAIIAYSSALLNKGEMIDPKLDKRISIE